jgi:TonB family protein
VELVLPPPATPQKQPETPVPPRTDTPPAAKPRPPARVQPARAQPAPPPTPTPELPPAPELSGNTLVGDGDAGWAAPTGNGAEREGPIQAGSAPVTAPAPPRPASVTAPAAPAVEPLAQLSRKPVPPALTAALERNYPATARSQGKSGEAKVRALIDALGHVANITVSSSTSPEFGLACQKTLQQSNWTPPLGQLGKPTATFITYRCKFRVDD